ncbi:MAG TPA: type I-E CRISPR-associated protein Cse1/CasA [Syntrophobacteraceae bacterium]|nr:type I-E CRISPR-associated protein Cse1/CasA [Syntrophobacteraceae bacterium]
MNLLTDRWVPIKDKENGDRPRHVGLRDILCGREPEAAIYLWRDDLEFAALHLLVVLTQVIAAPADARALKEREALPMTEAEYDALTEPYIDWFDLTHPERPFLQIRHEGKETAIQKLFPGLPDGNNHMFFHRPGEIGEICLSCASIVLWNQANNVPSFSGGFKGSLRGGSPITVLLYHPELRRCIWRNVLSEEVIGAHFPQNGSELPVWVTGLPGRGSVVESADIGFARGLLWQPACVELIVEEREGQCNSCGSPSNRLVREFKKQRWPYEVRGLWPHPHGSIRTLQKKGKQGKELLSVFLSLNNTIPPWRQLLDILLEKEDPADGYRRALVLTQYSEVWKGSSLPMAIGGYVSNQAAVVGRRHEVITLSAGWEKRLDELQKIVGLALDLKDILLNKMKYFFIKVLGTDLGNKAARKGAGSFFERTERLVLAALQNGPPPDLKERLERIAWSVFNELSEPYRHSPKGLTAHAAAKSSLGYALKQLGNKKGE